MLEREFVRVDTGSARYHRSLAHRLQRPTSAPIARPNDAERVRTNQTRIAHRSPLMIVALGGATSGAQRLSTTSTIVAKLAELRSRLARRRCKVAIQGREIRDMIETRSMDSPTAMMLRDITILALGRASGAKPGALVALNLGDIRLHSNRLRVRISRVGRKQWLMVQAIDDSNLCPVRALRDYLGFRGDGAYSRGLAEVPLFRCATRYGTLRAQRLTVQGLGQILKRINLCRGENEADVSGSSLRLGRIWDVSAACGADHSILANVVGYKSTTHISALAAAAAANA